MLCSLIVTHIQSPPPFSLEIYCCSFSPPLPHSLPTATLRAGQRARFTGRAHKPFGGTRAALLLCLKCNHKSQTQKKFSYCFCCNFWCWGAFIHIYYFLKEYLILLVGGCGQRLYQREEKEIQACFWGKNKY